MDSEGGKANGDLRNSARWMDYSGPSPPARDRASHHRRREHLFRSYANPRYPTCWHVRSDGWMGAAFCLQEGYSIPSETPLTLRYLQQAHRGPYDQAKAEAVHAAFAGRPGFEIAKSQQPHFQYEVRRAE